MALTTKEFADRPQWMWWVGGGVVLLAVILALASSCGGSEQAAPPAGSTSSSVPSESMSRGSVLPQKPDLQQREGTEGWLTSAPHAISWQRVDGVPFPFSDSDGPGHIDGAVTSGYSHTPQGAMLAAAHITFRLVWSADFEAVVQEQTEMSDSAREALLAGRRASGFVSPEVVAAVAKAPVAFKIADYSSERATVYLAFPSTEGSYRFAPVTVIWSGGDWKYTDLDPDTDQIPDRDNLDGFTKLPGQEEK